MKKNISKFYIIILALYSNHIFAQDTINNQQYFGFHYYLENVDINLGALGDYGYSFNNGFSFGANYTVIYNKYVGLDINIDYSYFILNHNGINSFGKEIIYPKVDKQYLSLPININVYFLKYFDVKTGAIFIMDSQKPNSINQSGIGLLFGFGAKLKLYNNIFIEIAPIIKVNTVLSFTKNIYTDRIIEEAIKFSLQFKIK